MKRKIDDGIQTNQKELSPTDYLSLAKQFHQEQKDNEALILIEQALLTESNNDSALRLYTEILLRLNKFNEAQDAIKKSLNIAPDNASNLSVYVQVLLKLNKLNEAYSTIRRAMVIEPNNLLHWYAFAQIAFKLNKFHEAKCVIKDALGIEPDNISSLNIYAQTLAALNKPDKALVAIGRALNITPDNASSSNIYAQILRQLNKPNEELGAIEKPLNIAPDNAPRNKLDEAQIAIEKSLNIEPDNAPNLNTKAQVLLKLNKLNEAYSTIRRAMVIEPNNLLHWYTFARIAFKLNKFHEAKSAIKDALDIEPDNISSLNIYAQILRRCNRPTEALDAIKKSLNIAPDNASCLNIYAQILLQLNKHDEAQFAIEKSLNIEPDDVSNLQTYAEILLQLNKTEEALIQIERALDIEPDNAPSLNTKAQILLQLNKANEAQIAIEKSLNIEPDNAPSLNTKAQILLQLNKLNGAQIAIEKSLNIEPDNAPGLNTKAQILLRLNKLDEARVAIKRALNIAPNNADNLNIHARILLRLNKLDEAHVAIGRALDIEPDNATHWYICAKFFVKANQLNDAQHAIKKALDITPDNISHLQTYAEILLQLNKSEEALIQIERALDMAPDNISNLNTYAQILLQLNKLNEAQDVIRKSLVIAPNNTTTSTIYALILSRSNKHNEAQTTIEQVLQITPYDNFAWHVHAEILNKIQAEQTHAACIENTFISKKYFNAELPSTHNSSDKKQQATRNQPLIKLCTFQQIKDIKQGSSLEELNPTTLKINQSEFTYYTKAPMLPQNNTPCIFIMAGRQGNAAIPTALPAPNRIILVITEEELKSVYLAHKNDISPAIVLPEGTDLLVINRLESPAYGHYDQTSLINARRAAALCVAFSLKLNYSMLMDDNIEELHCSNGTLANFNQLWAMHQPHQLISSIVTSSNRPFNAEDKKRLGSKLFLMNAVQLQQAFDFIKPEELAFFLFLPPHCSNLVMEDYYFQLLINHGLYLNNSLLQGHVALDEQTISLTRSSAHKSAAKKSANAFGAFVWLSLNTKTFITDSLAEKLSATNNCKAFISLLIKNVVSDIQKIVTNNLDNTNKYLSACKTTTLNKVQSSSKKKNKSLDKNQLWELIKNAPDLHLRPPQIKAIELWINEKNSGYLHSYSMATGVGKTYIKAIMAYMELACTDQPVIVVTADQKLVNNITEQFTSIFTKLNTHTQLNLSPNMIIPVMSSGNRAINQGSLAISDGFKVTQNLYVFCEDSFLKLIQERKVDVNHTSLILLDEYHCYTKTLDAAIKAVQGFIVYAGQMNEGASCYCIDVHQDCISLFNAQGANHLLDLKPSQIFNLTQIEVIRGMVETNKNPVQLTEQTILNSLQVTLQREQQKMPFPTFHPNNTNEIPFYWGHELPTTSIKMVSDLPAEMPKERTTYITPMGIYQANQTGITRCVITQDELIEYWRKSITAPLEHDKDELAASMSDYFAASINDDSFKHELNELIRDYRGIPCIYSEEEWGSPISPECFILTNVPPQLIYRNQNGQEQEIASDFDLYQIWGFEQMKERKNCFERIAFHQCLDLNKIAALKQLCADKQLASFPSVIKDSSTNMIGFSATPPKHNPLKCVFTYSKETAEKEGYITPSIVRLMDIKDFKNIPYKDIFTDVLTMNNPDGVQLCNRKGIYRFKSINELKKAEQILKETYKDLSISAVHTPKGKEHGYDEQLILKDFSTIPYNQGAVLLIVSKLQKGWDEPRLSYTVDFKKNPGINSAVQFLGRATRVCHDKNEQQLVANNKIGLGFFPTSAKNVKQNLEPLKTPLPQNKTISLFYSSKKKGCIEAGNYNLNSKQMSNG